MLYSIVFCYTHVIDTEDGEGGEVKNAKQNFNWINVYRNLIIDKQVHDDMKLLYKYLFCICNDKHRCFRVHSFYLIVDLFLGYFGAHNLKYGIMGVWKPLGFS